VLKDDPQFFTTVLREIHQKPGMCLCLDDDEANVSTAKGCGIDAHFYHAE
jgi:HAD superfamily hydrolase (TIGR01509 family)